MRASTSVTPRGGSDSGGTGNSCSPEIRSGARLETMTVSFGRRPEEVGDDRRPGDDLLEVVEHEQRVCGPGGAP